MSKKNLDKDGKKKKKWSLFGKKDDEFDVEDDIYYGIQIKPFDELKKGISIDPNREPGLHDTFAQLFDTSNQFVSSENEENFNKIQEERRRRVAEAAETAGVDIDDVAEDLGIVAPSPVTAVPQIIDTPANDSGSSFQQAMGETSKFQTMELKLNVLNDTIEVKKQSEETSIDDETINKIMEEYSDVNVDEENIQEYDEYTDENAYIEDTNEYQSEYMDYVDEDFSQDPPSLYGDVAYEKPVEEEVEKPQEPQYVFEDMDSSGTDEEETVQELSQTEDEEDTIDISQPLEEIAKDMAQSSSEDFSRYRKKEFSTHLLNMDIVQNAVDQESKAYVGKARTKVVPHYNEEVIEDIVPEKKDDYSSEADTQSISKKLKEEIKNLSYKRLIIGVIALVLLIGTLVSGMNAGQSTVSSFLVINVVAMVAIIAVQFKSILNGLKSVVLFNATSDSPMAVAVVAVTVQSIFAFFNMESITAGEMYVFGVVAAFIAFMNIQGKFSMAKRINGNFRFIAAKEQKYVVKTYDDINTAVRFAGDCVSGTPKITYQKKTGFLKRFLEISYEPDISEISSRRIAPFTLIISLVLFLITLYTTQSVYLAISALAATACLGTSVTNMTSINIPLAKISNKLRRGGAMVSGYQGVKTLANMNCVMTSASDLFPEGAAVIEGVKTFHGGHPEEALYSAIAASKKVGGVLMDIFTAPLKDVEVKLPEATDIILEDENGVSAIVGGKEVLIGNRAILTNHGIVPPERGEIVEFTTGGKKPLFVAIDGVLEIMLVVSYHAEKRKKKEILDLETNGVSLIVRTNDPNITPKFISGIFGIAHTNVNVVHGELSEIYQELIDRETPRDDALVATKGRVESLMNAVSTCAKEKSLMSVMTAVQSIAAILGILIMVLLSVAMVVGQLTPLAIILYQLFWVVIISVLPKIKFK